MARVVCASTREQADKGAHSPGAADATWRGLQQL